MNPTSRKWLLKEKMRMRRWATEHELVKRGCNLDIDKTNRAVSSKVEWYVNSCAEQTEDARQLELLLQTAACAREESMKQLFVRLVGIENNY